MGSNIMMLRITKNILKGIAFAACLLFFLYWIISTDPRGDGVEYPIKYTDRMEKNMKSRFFRTDGYYGAPIVWQSMPLIVVAIIGYVVVFLRRRIEDASGGDGRVQSGSRKLRISLLSLPLWVRSPLGVLSVGDVLFLLLIVFAMLYHLGRITQLDFYFLKKDYDPVVYETSMTIAKWSWTSYTVGKIAMLPFSLLWIPVSRGSPFLRLIKLPYEQAVKYHIWLGVITMFTLTGHSIGYTIYYYGAHHQHEIVGWETEGEACSVVAGVVAWAAGLAMWLTSLNYFRRRWYEVFFAVHHLYILFLLMWIYHVPWTIHFFSVPVLLFVLDRFLRFLQSRHAVTLLSARILDSGAMELKFPRNNFNRKGRLQPVYQALSSFYLKFPGLPKLLGHQWHALSVMSSPNDGRPELSIVIKPLGGWTKALQDQLANANEKTNAAKSSCPFAFKAGLEGPYGDESDFYLKYKSLVLVGGGIGVTPLVAILSDILHRYRILKLSGKENNLPTSIQLFHCVRTTEELCVLNSVNPLRILPDFRHLGLDITVHAFVTSPELEHTQKAIPITDSKHTGDGVYDLSSLDAKPSSKGNIETVFLEPANDVKPRGISPISATGETLWIGAIALASIVGFYVLYGLTNVFWIKKYDDKFPGYSRTHLILASMLLGCGAFGAAVVVLWSYRTASHRRKFGGDSRVGRSSGGNSPQHEVVDEEGAAGGGSPWTGTLQFGRRPDWGEVFDNLVATYYGQKVGVLVSGSPSMVEDIAAQCRKKTPFNMQTLLGSPNPEGVIFDFHSVSFEL